MNLQQVLTITLEAVVAVYTFAFIYQVFEAFNEPKSSNSKTVFEFRNEKTICSEDRSSLDARIPLEPKSSLPEFSQITLKQLKEIVRQDLRREQIEKLLGGQKYYRANKAALYEAISCIGLA